MGAAGGRGGRAGDGAVGVEAVGEGVVFEGCGDGRVGGIREVPGRRSVLAELVHDCRC